MSSPVRRLPDAPRDDSLGALEAVSAAVESGAGLPEVVRAAARALDASLVLRDAAGHTVAVAVRSPAEEELLAADGGGTEAIELRVGDEEVGRLHLRPRSGEQPGPAVLALVRTLIASEVERVRAPERASAQATNAFLSELLTGRSADGEGLAARAAELNVDVSAGASVVVARAHPHVPTDDDWRTRVVAAAQRGAQSTASGAIAAGVERADARAGEVAVLVPGADEALARRVADGVRRELEASLAGFSFAVGRSRLAAQPAGLPRAAIEALLAANVAAADAAEEVLAFEDMGAYLLLLPTLAEHPEELQRFYADTLEPVIAYDEQYETELVPTLEAFLDCDGNVAQTAQRLFTHRHTIRYRLERVRELSGHDVGSSDGREKLSLGLKAMRVLGIVAPRGPATEAGTEAGRVPRGPADRRR